MAPTILSYVWQIFKAWWWLPAPFIFVLLLKTLYLYWVRWEAWYPKINWILLEIKPPRETLKPFRAMEDVFSVLWGIYDGANWRERWCEGELPRGPFWASFEIASFGGDIHFYIWTDEAPRNMIESALYAHFPDIEISVVEDYTKKVPQDLPNKDWDLLAEDYRTTKGGPWPILGYSRFFEEKPEVTKEEKRLDPMDSLLEELAKLGPGEQFWFQIVAAPITNRDIPWQDEGRELADQIARRPGKPKETSWTALFKGAGEELAKLGGAVPAEEEKAKEKALPLGVSEEGEREMLITPGEREDLRHLEDKIGKKGFKVWSRIVYLYRRDVKAGGRHKIARSYFNHFSNGTNAIVYWQLSRTRIHYWFRKRRLRVRKRKQFLRYTQRLPYLFPRMENKPHFAVRWRKGQGIMILNTEEMASLFHFPAKITSGVVAAVKPIEARKGGAPPELPTG